MPTENNNVITYVVIINAPNPEKILMPGMTANATFFVTEKKDVLVVPNLALEFHPDPMAMQIYQTTHPQTKVVTNANNSADNLRGLFKIVWVKTADSIFPQSIQVGETDEINYEVLRGLQEGTEVIIAMTNLTASETITMKEESKSPFMPTPPGKTNKKQ
jgi:HlyD family secretion protein